MRKTLFTERCSAEPFSWQVGTQGCGSVPWGTRVLACGAGALALRCRRPCIVLLQVHAHCVVCVEYADGAIRMLTVQSVC